MLAPVLTAFLATTSTTLLLASPLSAAAAAAPDLLDSVRSGLRIDLRHNVDSHERRTRKREGHLAGDWLIAEKERVELKYGRDSTHESRKREVEREVTKRQNANNVVIADQQYDASYSASVAFGTPVQYFELALDTGSADLWVLSNTCETASCQGLSSFRPGYSTSFKNQSTAFSIKYGSGAASGYLASDKVTLGGYSVDTQVFAVVQSMTASLITSPLSGIMGLAFPNLAQSGATPWWVSLASAGSWTDPLFGVYLARFRDVAGASATESNGGYLTLGYLDSSLYSGDVTYVSVTGDQYWNIPIDSVTVQGSTISLDGLDAAAIDTGTTLIGGPASAVAAVYAAIPGSQAMTGGYSGYYEYPCSTNISLTMTFGGFTIEVGSDDFNIGSYSSDSSMCTGGIYVQGLSSSSPIQWVVGDTLLKNVYSIYRYSPAAVGFAALPGAVAASATTAATSVHAASTLSSIAPVTFNATASVTVSATASATSSRISRAASSSGAAATGSGVSNTVSTSPLGSASATAIEASSSTKASSAGWSVRVPGSWLTTGSTAALAVLIVSLI